MTVAGIVLHPSSSALLDTFLRKPAHAVLLAGPAGIGKTHIAQALAVDLLGIKPDSLENQAYYRSVGPIKGTTTIEQVRELIKFFRLTVPGTGKVKRVVVITDAETMGREAQNAILKLLEEPPAGSVLILTSSQPEQLLSTVRSRTQLLGLSAPEQSAVQQFFESEGLPRELITRALLRSGTNIADAYRLLTSEATEDSSLLLVKQVLTGTPYDRMLLVDGLGKQKEQAAAFVSTLATTAMASLSAAAEKNPNGLGRWQTILQAAETAASALERNGNTKLVLTELMLAL